MRLLYILFILFFTSCGVGFQYTTLNHTDHIDGIYSSNDHKIDTLNEFQVRNRLRTDFNFRYNIAQYALSQPASFDWNNRLLGNRYSFYNSYYSRTQIWNDWIWGYNWYSPSQFSPFSNNWGFYQYYGWNNYGWGYNNMWSYNRRNNWNYGYHRYNYTRYRGTNVAYHRRRNNTRTINRRTVNNNRVVTNASKRNIIKTKPRIIKTRSRINNPKPRTNQIPRRRVNTPTRQFSTVRPTPLTPTLSSNTRTVRSNSRRKN